MTKNILLISDKEKKGFCEVTDRKGIRLEWIVRKNAEEGIEEIKKGTRVYVVLIDQPSKMTGIQELIDFVDETNSYVYSMPVLLLTSEETVEEDVSYMGGVVVDCIRKPVQPVVLGNRIRNSKRLIGSVSFDDFANMLKALPANIYLKDTEGRYVFSSQTWHHLNTEGDVAWTIRGKTDLEIRKDKENAKLALESDLELVRTGKPVSYIIEENDDGQEFLQIIKEPLFDEKGKVNGIIALINDVTEQELLHRELKYRSVTDQLTGLFNRSCFDEYISQMSRESVIPLSIIYADCDDLKRLNDTFGHEVGDEYIRLGVTVVKTCLPDAASIFRVGGDEFVAFLPRTDKEEAIRLIGQMNENARTYVVKGYPLSISFGCSTLELEDQKIIDCLKQADKNMYEDKQRKKKKRRQGVLTDRNG